MTRKVVNFHKVTNAEWFESVVRFLKSTYTMIGADQLLGYYYHRKEIPCRSCLITVDDGDASSYYTIYPILKKYQIPAIFFVSPEKMMRSGNHVNYWFQEARNCDDSKELMRIIHNGSFSIDQIWEMVESYKSSLHVQDLPCQNMTLEQVMEIDKDGLVTIGAHTMEHPFLARESDERSDYEIKASVSQLEKLLGHPILTFAYPNGRPILDFGEREMTTLKQTSCRLAFSTQANDFSLSDSPYAIPRYGLTLGSILFVMMKLSLGSHYASARKIIKSVAAKLK